MSDFDIIFSYIIRCGINDKRRFYIYDGIKRVTAMIESSGNKSICATLFRGKNNLPVFWMPWSEQQYGVPLLFITLLEKAKQYKFMRTIRK